MADVIQIDEHRQAKPGPCAACGGRRHFWKAYLDENGTGRNTPAVCGCLEGLEGRDAIEDAVRRGAVLSPEWNPALMKALEGTS